MNAHWTNDDLIARLYGVGPEDCGHLDLCPECRARFESLTVQHRALTTAAAGAIPQSLLDRQRRTILDRATIAAPAPSRWFRFPFAPAMAGAAAAVVLGVFLMRPVPVPPMPAAPPAVAASDQQLMADVSAIVDTPVPNTVAAISGLFDEDAAEEN